MTLSPKRRTLWWVAAAVAVAIVIVLFVVAQQGKRLDRTIYGVARGPDGDLQIVVSPCEPYGIGSLELGTGPKGERPEIIFAAQLKETAASVYGVSVADVPDGYVIQGSGDNMGSEAVLWQLTAADGANFLAVPLRFDPESVTAGTVVRGDGRTVGLEEWTDC